MRKDKSDTQRVLYNMLVWSDVHKTPSHIKRNDLPSVSYSPTDEKAFMILERWWKEGLNEVNGYDIAKVYVTILHNTGSVWGNWKGSNCSRILLKEMGEDLPRVSYEHNTWRDNISTLSSFFKDKEDTKLAKPPTKLVKPPQEIEPFENNLKGDLGNFREYFNYFYKNSWEKRQQRITAEEKEKNQPIYEGAVLPGLERDVPFDLEKIIEIPEEKKEFLYQGGMSEDIEWRVRSKHGDEKIDKLIHEEEHFHGHTELENIWAETVWEMEKEIEEEYADSYKRYEEEKKKQQEIEGKEKIENLVIMDEKWSGVKQGLNLKTGLSTTEKWTLEQLYSPHLETNQIDRFNRKWEIGGLKHWVFIPNRDGLFNIDNNFKLESGEYNIAYAGHLPLPCEIVFQLHELPCIIDFWLVLDKPEPSKPYGTITFDSPEDLLSIDEIDLVLTQTISTKELMEFFARDVELMPLARNELPEMMRDYYSV